MAGDTDELVPNCATCRQHFEDNGHAMLARAQQKRLRALTSSGPIHNISGPNVRDIVAREMCTFHEEHRHHDN